MRYIRLNNKDRLYISHKRKQAARRFEFPTEKINVHAGCKLLLRARYILKREPNQTTLR